MKSISVILIFLCFILSVYGQTSETESRLKNALKKYPAADKNKDGILTMAEAKAYLSQMKAGAKMKKPAVKLTEKLYSKEILDLKYGQHERNVIDLWLAKSDKPTPLMIYIHGGGFKGGDKAKGRRYAEDFLEKGISFASINYRFMPQSANGVRGCLNDSKRALQFLRYKATEFNLDKTKFACMGGSAGAGTSLWLAFTDDMANPQSKDPVNRESTRISAVVALGVQCTYNLQRWQEVMDIKGEGNVNDALAFYGLKSIEEMETDEGRKIIGSLDMLDLMSKDDPPFYVMNTQPGGSVDVTNKGHLYHHANHAKALKERAQKIGVEHLCFAPKIGIKDSSDPSIVNFVQKYFKD